jgi:hypothetical protein
MLFVSLLILINLTLLALLFYLRLGIHSKSIGIEEHNRVVSALNNTIQYQKSIMLYQLFTEQRQIPPHSFVCSERNDSIRLANLINRPVLVLRYNELGCQTCVDALISALLKVDMLKDSNTLLLTYYRDPSYLRQFKRINRLSMPIYNIKHTSLTPDTLNLPYFFVLHKDLTVSNVYIPEEGDTNSVNLYLKYIGKKFGNESI